MNDNTTTMNTDDPDVNGAELAQPPVAEKPADNRTPFVLFVRDLPWPSATDHVFDVEVPQPAVFQRAYRVVGRRGTVLRLVWMAASGGPVVRGSFLLQHMGEAMRLTEGDEGEPQLLAVVSSAQGTPIALWQVPTGEPAEEALAAP